MHLPLFILFGLVCLWASAEEPPLAPHNDAAVADSEKPRKKASFNFATPSAVEKFSASGRVRQSQLGLEFPGKIQSWADSLETFSYPLTATFVVATKPDGNSGVFPAIFVQGDLNKFWTDKGIFFFWGYAENKKTVLRVFGKEKTLRHSAVEPNTFHVVEMSVDKARKLVIEVNGKLIHSETLPLGVDLSGAVRCGAGIGHVIYRGVTVNKHN